MKFTPHDYQKYCVDFVEENPTAALILDCGLGKTAIALTAINDMLYDSFTVSKVLVVAPLRVARDTWPDEIQKWDDFKHLRPAVIVGDTKTRLNALNSESDIYIINRENIPWLAENKPKSLHFDLIVIDELSSFKNHRSKRFKALRQMIRKDTRMVGLTGTPTSNGLMDLFAEIGILDGGEHLGRYITHFRDRYFNHFGQWDYTLKKGAEEEIYEAIRPITISMKALDYLDMPDLVVQNEYAEMDPNEKKLYKQLKEDYVLFKDDTVIDAKTAATLSGKLSQLANGFLYDENKKVLDLHSRKLDVLLDIIEEAQGQPLMVAYWYQADRDKILKAVKGTRELKSSQDIKDWEAGKISVALIHPASAGHGLNLQHGGYILIWYGLTWSLELYEQTIGRLYRQGQTSSRVVIKHIITKGTIDERIINAIKAKDTTQQAMIDAVKAEL